MIPRDIVTDIEAALADRVGPAARVVGTAATGGGCIARATRLELASGERFFLKWALAGELPTGLFREEARSLAALLGTRTVRVPEVLAMADDGDGGAAWLLMEWLEPGRPAPRNWRHLGEHLAGLHRHRDERVGWPTDNFIGSLPQINGWSGDWPSFWRDRRLRPQLQQAARGGAFGTSELKRFDRLLERMDELLAAAQGDEGSLVHGDLWSGNVHFLADGSPAILDPSSYYGHREIDLAMSELFGGFTPDFYRAYQDAWPLEPGYHQTRRPLYQLYYLLVHVNLFGGGYIGQTLDTLRRLE